MKEQPVINIARQYGRDPGPRHRKEGPLSGEQFREELLLPQFRAARAVGVRLIIDFDGVRYGYPASFLEEAFGGLARVVGESEAAAGLDLRCTDEPPLVDEVLRYIRDANKTSVQRAAPR